MEYKKNQTVTVAITDIGKNGEGIGRSDDYILFVKDAIAGDTVEAVITKVKKNYGYARCLRVITPSADRTEPFCEQHRRCGGCQIQAMSYDAQQRVKENKVRNDLIRIGHVPAETVERVFEPMIGMDAPIRYRNKSQYPVGTDADGNIVAGFFAGRTHHIIPCTDCGIAPEENKEILGIILDHMRKHGIRPYDEEGSGTVRHVLIRKGFATGQIMVCLVIRYRGKASSGYIPGQEELIERLMEIPGMTSICVSVNNEKTNVIMGNEIHTIAGSDTITDILLGKRFEISPLSFYQVNPVQTEKLYRTAIEFAQLTGKEDVWDICCGIGTISLCMADKAKSVHGLEIVPEAIEDAKKNAVSNGVENAQFICAAAEDYLPAHKDEIAADVIVLDPPRKGMDPEALSAIADTACPRIVYVSCDSATLSRDIEYLTERGYELERVRCTDMFPHTIHVETVVLLSKGEIPSKKVKVEFSLEGMDTDGFKDGATYDEIRDWVQEKYGIHVTNLNIAQIKRKNGIIERENYNKPKSEDSRQPGTTPEKEKAITEALKHFNMI